MTHLHTAARQCAALVVACCASVMALAAQGELIEIAWPADGRFGRDLRVAPKQFVEVCGRLGAGTAVAWRFESGARLDFNLHYHEGQAVHYPTRQSGVMQASGTFVAPVDQDYCWMWTNPGAAESKLGVSLQKR